jgi:hypothetical protein
MKQWRTTTCKTNAWLLKMTGIQTRYTQDTGLAAGNGLTVLLMPIQSYAALFTY